MVNEALFRIDQMLRKQKPEQWDVLNWVCVGYARTVALPHFVFGRSDEMWYTIVHIPLENKFAIIWYIRIAESEIKMMRFDLESCWKIKPQYGDDYPKKVFESDALRTAVKSAVQFIAQLSAFYGGMSVQTKTVQELKVDSMEIEEDIEFFRYDELRIDHIKEDHTTETRFVAQIFWSDLSNEWYFVSTRHPTPAKFCYRVDKVETIATSTLIDKVLV